MFILASYAVRLYLIPDDLQICPIELQGDVYNTLHKTKQSFALEKMFIFLLQRNTVCFYTSRKKGFQWTGY